MTDCGSVELTPAAAQRIIDAEITRLPVEDCLIEECYGQTLREDILSGNLTQGVSSLETARSADAGPSGQLLLRDGTRLGPPEIALAAAHGLRTMSVSRQPRLTVISTGDELVAPGQPIADYQVRRSNAYAIVAALIARGLSRVANDHIPDDPAILAERMSLHLARSDILILSGGVSKGKFDLVPKVLKELGVREVIYHVAQRPGAPMWFGVGPAGQLVFGLPGNPVATMVCLIRYVVRAAARAMGSRDEFIPGVALAAAVKKGRPMTYFLPVAMTVDSDGRPGADPRPPNGPGDFLALSGTDGFLELPPQPEGFPRGFIAPLYRW